MATTVTSKGQVTIPKAVRDRLGIKPGHAVDFRVEPDGKVVLLKVGGKGSTDPFQKWVGIAGPGPSTDEIMEMSRGEP
ncbi:AbrB/MazE/SpoVT family DNA-binding domain-containing protein [Bosea sp. MMO-172]|uniref:AbrB/MazE/SpoVT family DNA-binding domain-containing protein n=1 Tax=Bosea sp. MMO-172 TaxID=3127885 RepID=UPI003017AFE0